MKENKKSFIVAGFSRFIEWGNEWLTLAHWLFKENDPDIFRKLEVTMVLMIAICFGMLLSIDKMPLITGTVVCILLIQRVVEFVIVYSRNFILDRGRIFSDYHDEIERSQWLLIMFSLNIAQVIVVFATWYHFIGSLYPDAFSQPMGILNSLYFSVVTFVTVGFGDIAPVSPIAKILVMGQNAVTFYTLVVVVNGIVTLHFRDKRS